MAFRLASESQAAPCRVLNGVMFQKDVVSPGRMRRKIHNPRILLMDCPIEYKKGENQTNVEIEKEEDWWALVAYLLASQGDPQECKGCFARVGPVSCLLKHCRRLPLTLAVHLLI